MQCRRLFDLLIPHAVNRQVSQPVANLSKLAIPPYSTNLLNFKLDIHLRLVQTIKI